MRIFRANKGYRAAESLPTDAFSLSAQNEERREAQENVLLLALLDDGGVATSCRWRLADN